MIIQTTLNPDPIFIKRFNLEFNNKTLDEIVKSENFTIDNNAYKLEKSLEKGEIRVGISWKTESDGNTDGELHLRLLRNDELISE